MSLFEFIENKRNTPPPAVPNNQKTAIKTVHYESKTKPEKLKFLKPCPLCEGREFICTKKGDFFCIQCKPGVTGSPVIAKGSWDFLEIAPSPGPTKQHTPETEPDYSEDSKEESRPGRMSMGKYSSSFQTAFPWIMKHLADLEGNGWTRPALFRRGKHKIPLWNWGIAWMDIWSKNDLEVQIRSNGTLVFHFSSSGRRITQTANSQQYTQREKPKGAQNMNQ